MTIDLWRPPDGSVAGASIVYAVVDALSPTLLDGVALTIVSGGLWIAAAIEWPMEQR